MTAGSSQPPGCPLFKQCDALRYSCVSARLASMTRDCDPMHSLSGHPRPCYTSPAQSSVMPADPIQVCAALTPVVTACQSVQQPAVRLPMACSAADHSTVPLRPPARAEVFQGSTDCGPCARMWCAMTPIRATAPSRLSHCCLCASRAHCVAASVEPWTRCMYERVSGGALPRLARAARCVCRVAMLRHRSSSVCGMAMRFLARPSPMRVVPDTLTRSRTLMGSSVARRVTASGDCKESSALAYTGALCLRCRCSPS